ncbi:MAG TPA: methanogenesis marker 3 protein [Methanocorpusculum sp.]|nr:methanogenesis marker 3 protein [Methanocorpusculum sp.]HJK21008.1 methanogenesis marker 3 protein [Methanocorpusculum sp.]HJK25733.1 methanogenesis marker 3 protein [Methanocorpusculum sp.]HJK26972.1 methanogenesis marker 3 protein [Methanocorpusculum sp.]HJK29293.1 methanogenesis marker 3 protein [Methanocorpusculum sp.]
MQIFLNGEAKDVPQGTTLSTLLPSHPAGCGVAILRPGVTASGDVETPRDTSHLRFTTTAGDIVVELLPGVVLPVPTGDVSNANLRVHWEDKYAVAFGPFRDDFIPDHQSYRYDRGVLCLGCGGYDSGTSYLMFSRLQHMGDHGAASGGAILGTVISGLGIMNRWRNGDRITKIEHVFTSVDKTNAFVTTDLSLEVEDGMQIFSEILINAEGYKEDHSAIDTSCTKSVEHLLFALRNSEYLIDRTASTYIRDHAEGKLAVPMELQKPRREGTVTVRTSGKSSGAIYIYTKDIPSNQHHTRTGTVVRGIELARFANVGTKLSVKVVPEQLDLRGLPLGEAVARAKARGLRVLADNRDVDGRVVIDQNPATTLEVLKEGKVALSTVALEDVIDITLDYEHAPRTVDLFRRVTGLKIYAIGSMPFFYNIDDEMYLFKPKFASNVNIIPENVPKQPVPPYSLAVTNDARKARGMTGVRSVANEEYGPTGEPFEGTNVIGTVLDIDKLPLIKDGSTVFIREVKP